MANLTMVWMGILDYLLKEGAEQKAFERSKNIIMHATKANALLKDIVNGSSNISGVRKLGKESDKEVFEIVNSITAGAIAPNLIEPMRRFVRREDEIVDHMFSLARALVRYRIKDKRVSSYANRRLMELNGLTYAALKDLHEMQKSDEIKAIGKLRTKIVDIEQAGDDIKDEMLTFAYSSKIDYKTFNHLLDVAYLTDDILDACEGASDMYFSIMLSILT